jgi:serine protease Do
MASRWSRLALVPLLCCPSVCFADTLKITSTPAGATVEIDGVTAGITPFEKDYPGGYFHRPKTSIGSRLEHALAARISLAGYATKEIQLTDGPMNWVSLNGRNHGEYWLFKSAHFEVQLQPIGQVFTGGVTAKLANAGSVDLEPELSLEELVRRAKPAVVYLKGLDKSGTGFFVTETGVIATNAHVARGEESLLAVLPGGQQLEAKVVYIDADLDIALTKVEGQHFPRLALAEADTVRQGESVVAIGNPGDAMLFSVTKGIVSAVGRFPNAGPGTWIQTDTPINPGNSGGPLLNSRGEVIGINTQKLVKKNVTGIGFALSATDLLEVLRRFYPSVSAVRAAQKTGAATSLPAAPEQNPRQTSAEASAQSTAAGASVSPKAAPGDADSDDANSDADAPPTKAALAADPSDSANDSTKASIKAPPAIAPRGFGTVLITCDTDDAEVYVDDKFIGNAPAKLKLAAGTHVIVVKAAGFSDWKRTFETLKDSQVTLRPVLQRSH